MKAWDPTAKGNLINTKCTHQRQTHNNTPGEVPAITQVPPQIIPKDVGTPHEKQRLTCVLTQRTYPTVEFTPGSIKIPLYPIPGGIRASARLLSQQAMNMLTKKEALNPRGHSHPNILYTNCTKIISQTMHILHHPWSILQQAKQSPATNNWCMIPKLLKSGKWHSVKILAEGLRVTTRLAKKAQIQCSLWHMRKLMWQLKRATNGLTHVLLLIIDHKRPIPIGSA